MEARRQNSPPVDDGQVAVTAPTLQEAYRRVRKEHGEGAVIVGSRSVARRENRGLGHVREVEVLVQTGPVRGAVPAAAPAATVDLGGEVARIESLVTAIESEFERLRAPGTRTGDGPVAALLRASGASGETVRHLCTRFESETGRPAGDRPALLVWLAENLSASNVGWEGFYGCHAFLGRSGTARTELVLNAARELQARGRRTLVLAILPAHRGEVRRLQSAAAGGGFDAAVIQKLESITAVSAHLTEYDAVLLDLPDLDLPAMAGGRELHRWLAGNEGFHRHLVLPLDGDPRDLAELGPVARDWNCDWVALTHTARSRRWGKVLDLQRAFALPLSLLAAEAADAPPLIAASGDLLERMLATDVETTYVPALPGTAEA